MKKGFTKKVRRLTASDLLVTPKYTRWLETQEARDAVYPEWVIQRIVEELRKGDRDRTKSFGSSSAGECQRKQLLKYLGAPALDFDMDTIAVFLTGNWNHLMMQAGMLASGAIEDIEVPHAMPEFRARGTGDGYGVHEEHGEFGWEHKSINGRNFKFVLSAEKPIEKHLYQAHRGMLATGLRLWSFTYDCKEDQDWKEFVIHYDESIAAECMDELVELNHYVEDEELPDLIEPCKERRGPFRNCMFRKVCPTANNSDFDWPETTHSIADVMYGEQDRNIRIRLPRGTR